jgi:hypothetical protein
MALNFPNPSRFYDATRRAVRFWGHDGALEAAFFMNVDASRVSGAMRQAFSVHSIHTSN